MIDWFKQQFHQRAANGGEQVFGRTYKGGEFLPFYVPRPVMPQIDEADMLDFIEFACERGVDVVVRYLAPKQLHAHQRIDQFKVHQMPPEVANKTVFISEDMFILDGNHRWMYHRIHRTKVPCFTVKLPFERAIELMFEFPKTYALESHNEQN